MSSRPCHFSGGGRSAFVKHVYVARLDRDLAASACGRAGRDREEVAEVEVGEAGVRVLADDVLLEVALDAAAAVAQSRNVALPMSRSAVMRPATQTSGASPARPAAFPRSNAATASAAVCVRAVRAG